MKVALLVAVALLGVVIANGCSAIPNAPVIAAIVLDEKGPVSVGDMRAGMKVGVAQAEGILVVSYGDASISAAMANGGLTKVHHVDNETFGVLGIYARYKTIVYGE